MKQEDYTYWLHLCKTSAVVQKLCDTDRAAKLYFVNTRLCGVHDGESEATVRLEVQYGSKPVDVWIQGFSRKSEKFHYTILGWSVVCFRVTRIDYCVPFLFPETKNSDPYVTRILTTFLKASTDYERTYSLFSKIVQQRTLQTALFAESLPWCSKTPDPTTSDRLFSYFWKML